LSISKQIPGLGPAGGPEYFGAFALHLAPHTGHFRAIEYHRRVGGSDSFTRVCEFAILVVPGFYLRSVFMENDPFLFNIEFCLLGKFLLNHWRKQFMPSPVRSCLPMELNYMNIGPVELVVVFFNLVLICGIPLVIILAAIILFRRFRDLEARVEQLEGEQDSPTAQSGGPK
jgi:hypothetical protein